MMRKKGFLEKVPIVIVWLVVSCMIAIAFFHAIGLWPEEWRFRY